ncbi:MAG: NAD(P)-dependent alcohol dehydrogenase [Chloroflexi bacterium]|nr:NAD(P)-dependent alcohol dehydrogenase [Chloroflexota bacterium]
MDAAGTVEVVGPAVTHVKPGDDVFGSRSGAFAEYLSGRNFVSMPAGLTFGEAAAVPTAGMTALQAVRDQARVQAGQRVLVNGAGGGVGTFAVQIAKSLGAEVTAVTNTANLDLVSSLGADHIVDHTRDDFTRAGPSYEVILDPGGTRSILDLRRTVTGDGTVVLIGPGNGQWIGPIARMAGAVVASRLGNRRVVFFLAKVNKDDLLVLKALIEEGKVRPVVDRTYSLADTADAVRYMEAGRVRGKVVITV